MPSSEAKKTKPKKSQEWEKKHNDPQQALDRKQAESILRHTISNLTLAQDDRHNKLASKLVILHDALRHGGDVENLRQIIDDILEKIAQSNSDQEGDADVTELDATNQTKKPVVSKKGKDIAPLLVAPAAGELLLQLMERLPPKLINGLDRKALKRRTTRARTRKDLLLIIEVIASHFASVFESMQEGAPQQEEKISAHEILIQLLERIDLSDDLGKRAEGLKDKLIKNTAHTDLLQGVEDTAYLIATMRSRVQSEKRELEAFLKQLTGYLQEVDNSLQELSAGDVDEDYGKRAVALLGELSSSIHDIVEESEVLRKKVKQKYQQALHDTLTNLPNRLAYEEHLAGEYARFQRYKSPFVLAVWGVDHFRKINDNYGHPAGDKVLKVIAEVMSKNTRKTDYLARYGGDKFVVIIPECTQAKAEVLTEKLRKALAEVDFHYRKRAVPISASCGFAECAEQETVAQLFKRAEKALAEAKAVGRNRCLGAEKTE